MDGEATERRCRSTVEGSSAPATAVVTAVTVMASTMANVEREVDERRGVGDRDVDGKGSAHRACSDARARVRVLRVDGGVFSGDESALERRGRRRAAEPDGF